MINYVQHIAIGVRDVDTSYRFYRDILGFKVIFFDAKTIPVPDVSMDSYNIDDQLTCDIRMFFALHPMGGAGIEFAQFKHVDPVAPVNAVKLGDAGYVELAIRVHRLEEFAAFLEAEGVELFSSVKEGIQVNGSTGKYVYLRDPDGTLIRLYESTQKPLADKPCTMGIGHLGVGVTDIEAACDFYANTMEYGEELDRWDESFEGLNTFCVENLKTRNILFGNNTDKQGHAGMINQTNIKLIENVDYKGKNISSNRRWGDLGLLEIAVDTSDIDSAIEVLKHRTAHPSIKRYKIRLGIGSYGYYSFVLDPFGNLVELVDLKKIWFLPANVVSSAMYPVVQAVNRNREFNWNWDPFFDVSI